VTPFGIVTAQFPEKPRELGSLDTPALVLHPVPNAIRRSSAVTSTHVAPRDDGSGLVVGILSLGRIITLAVHRRREVSSEAGLAESINELDR
jgi:hypothetical protein